MQLPVDVTLVADHCQCLEAPIAATVSTSLACEAIAIAPDLTGEVIAHDECGEIEVLQVPAPGDALPAGEHEIRFSAIGEDGAASEGVVSVRIRVGYSLELRPPLYDDRDNASRPPVPRR